MSRLIDAYLDTWNETDGAKRRDLLAEHWSEDVTYIDPMTSVAGHDALHAAISAVQAQFPGFVFSALGAADAHHHQARFGWGLGPAGQEPIIEGFDVVTTDEHGRINSVLGFLDKVPAGA